MSTQSPSRNHDPLALQRELQELSEVVSPTDLVDLLLERAFGMHATDLHFDPTEEGMRVRLRKDGRLHDILNLYRDSSQQVVSRLKLLADLDITERRIAQDGHISNFSTKSGRRDVRIATSPTVHGERVVLRLMPDTSQLQNLEDLGLAEEQQADLRKMLDVPYGTILAAGPVGSGKTTAMYACLGELNESDQSVVTIEDPVERRIAGMSQIQIDPRVDFGFPDALKGCLRQDPDVMMVGEIRDAETAQIACRAGLTGVTVLSTIHANDTATTIDVLREFGIPPMFIAESLVGVVSMRLVRKICEHCRELYEADEATAAALSAGSEGDAEPSAEARDESSSEPHGLPVHDHQGQHAAPAAEDDGPTDDSGEPLMLARGAGCGSCFGTGYAGRTGIFELLVVDKDVRKAIVRERPADEIKKIARRRGFMTLSDAARRKVLDHETTTEEYFETLTFETRR